METLNTERLLTNRILSSKSTQALFAMLPQEIASFNSIHWAAFFNRLHLVQKGKLPADRAQQLLLYTLNFDKLSFSPGQLGQIAQGCGKCSFSTPELVETLMSQALHRITDFKDKELHMLLLGIRRLASQEQMASLFCQLHKARLNPEYLKQCSPALLAMWIGTGLRSHIILSSYKMLWKAAEERIEEFSEAQLGELFGPMDGPWRARPPISFFKACEASILSKGTLLPHTWGMLFPSLGDAGFYSHALLDMALKECANGKPWDKIGVLYGACLMKIKKPEAKEMAMKLARTPWNLENTWLCDENRLLDALFFQIDLTDDLRPACALLQHIKIRELLREPLF